MSRKSGKNHQGGDPSAQSKPKTAAAKPTAAAPAPKAAPATKPAAPAAAKSAPAAEAVKSAPVETTSAPVAEAVKSAPVETTSAPVAEAAKPAPVETKPAPVAEAAKPAPVETKPAPAAEAAKPAPVETKPAPAAKPAFVVLPQTPGGKLSTQPALLGINREGWLFVGAGLIGWLVLGHIWGFLGTLSLLFAVWCAWFFRDPKRVVPVRPGLVISPADGVVQTVEQAVPPAELGFGPEPRPVVRVFMNVFNVHVNRVPASGTVARTAYRPGKFFDASLDKASEHNERVAVRLTLDDGRGDIAFVQIAGLVARRISNGLKDGQKVKAGERFGLIRFGSRLDIYLPEGAKPLVAVGQTAIAGETVLADLTSAEPARIGTAR